MIELATLPPIIQQYIQENGVVELRLVDGEVIATPKLNDTTDDDYNEHFYRHFDIEYIKQAIGETDEHGRAKHTIRIPEGVAQDKEAFREWVKANNAS